MYEYWVKFKLSNGHESLVILPSKLKVFFWLLRHIRYCNSVSITVMLDI